MRALQGIASAALGPAAFEQGARADTLGVLFHFVVAFSAAAVYCLAAARLRFMLEHAFLVGPLYGIAVHLFMTFVVLPLSRLNRRFAIGYFLVQLVVHMFAVGLPIGLIARKFL